ncbi:MAG: hypothetical protein AAF236_03450 [Verrucomicrobiota bacterium]
MRKFLTDHDVTTVQREGLGGTENGALLDQLDGRFDVLILCDKNLRYQQNLTNRSIAIVELPTNRWPILEQLKVAIVNAVSGASAGVYIVVEDPSTEEKSRS